MLFKVKHVSEKQWKESEESVIGEETDERCHYELPPSVDEAEHPVGTTSADWQRSV